MHTRAHDFANLAKHGAKKATNNIFVRRGHVFSVEQTDPNFNAGFFSLLSAEVLGYLQGTKGGKGLG